MEHILGGFQLPFQRRLTKLYTDTKGSYEFVKEPIQITEDPDLSSLHRKLRIQKDRLISWGLEWSDPSQSPDIDESLSRAGLGDVVGSVMSTIKDILAEAEPLWNSSKSRTEKSEKSGDSKTPFVTWDRNRFEDLIRDLTGSIDILYDLSRTRQSARQTPGMKHSSSNVSFQAKAAQAEQAKLFESTRMKTPQQIDPSCLIDPRNPESTKSYPSLAGKFSSGENPARQIVYMRRPSSATNPWKTDAPAPLSPVLLEYAAYDQIYASTGIPPEMERFEKLFAGLQTAQGLSGRPEYGVLSLIGYFEDTPNARFGLLYELPNRFSTWDIRGNQISAPGLLTLSEVLSNSSQEPALEVKFRLASNIVSTLVDLHLKGIMHGNLNTHNVSFVDQRSKTITPITSKVNIRHPFVTSFDLFPENAQHPISFDQMTTHERLYRHPLDPRLTPRTNITHDSASIDLHSLGLILLEIGLWRPLTSFSSGRSISQIDLDPYYEQLSIRCGKLYSKAVQTCFKAVEIENSKQHGATTILQGTYDTVTSALDRCCAIDDDEESTSSQPRSQPDIRPLPSLPQRAERKENIQSDIVSTERYPLDRKVSQFTFEEKPPRLQQSHPTVAKPQETTAVSAPKPKMRMFPLVEIEAHHWDTWNRVLMPAINKALRGFYRKHPESVEISLESIGETTNTTKPTILVLCTSVGKVRSILKKNFVYDATTYGLMVCRGKVFRSRKNQARRSAAGDAAGHMQVAENPDYQERPLNGASIGAFVEGQHLPPVSFGGLVMVGDKPYGLTVHHMLDDPTAQEELIPITEPANRFDIPSLDASDYEPQNEDDGYAVSEHGSDYSETSSDGDVESDNEDDAFQPNEVGDIEGIPEGCGEGYAITQPALDDVDEAFYPDEETVDEDHLESCRLGEIYASSGIRRRHQDGIAHEIDWALFEFSEDRAPATNYIKGGEQHCQAKERYPVEIAPWSSLHGLEIHCNARTTGLQKGRIMPGMTIVKIFGRQTPSQSYQVSGRLGVPGDSGAWIIDNAKGRACGHVLAWSSRKQVAYICPMEIILADIADTLKTEVSLPTDKVSAIEDPNHHAQLTEYENSNVPILEGKEDVVAKNDDLNEGPRIENTKHLASVRYSKMADEDIVASMHGMHVSHSVASQS